MNQHQARPVRKSILSIYGIIICAIFVCTLVFALAYSGGGAEMLAEEQRVKEEEEAAAIEAAKPTPTPILTVTSSAGRLIPYMENGLWGYKNTSGEIVILPSYSSAMEFDGSTAFAAKDGLYGLINRSGAWIAEPVWSNVLPFSEGYAAVESGEKWGIIC